MRDLFLRDVSVWLPTEAAEPEEIRVEFMHDTHFFAALSNDLSCGGLFVATYRVVPVGTRVRVCFELPDGVRVETQGEVRWIREQDSPTLRSGLAIRFTDVTPESLRLIAEFCSTRPPLLLDFD